MGEAVYFFDPNKHLIEIRHYAVDPNRRPLNGRLGTRAMRV